ncbi:Holliday junction branch migration protein RuvA [Blattabacterium sp. (Cryptocercus punctulatus) str. Cpu]|uniref:Holliday junction branch migration protein RuvA n=1 Tax=Blattabacterium sp. (Cryptocercus punctulatus) str. Cpu TaxID=1075399 RepID=UPI000238710E|nr:Holliday junction branch migration protein RuvA [Blattabacterium sp. (Cryptocercus punctulatus) str. Cpu]AEU09389.1 Holliday junction DNA helicase RuvA [Blattabacterium sp. (Cryptocercus punctulatus) str. Cpu]
MITHLRGKLIEKNQSYLIIDCNGIGYYIHISLSTYSSFSTKKEGEEIYIYTYLFIKEHQHVLYGFFDRIERKIFSDLISVNGIGPNSAITLLSSLTPYEIEQSIFNEEIEVFKRVKGIGIKTAHRIIIELKDKIGIFSKKEKNVTLFDKNTPSIIKKEALSALIVLGFSTKESKKVLEDILEKNPRFTVENLIKESIKKL